MSLIELRAHDGKYVPILTCEKCRKPFKSIHDAMLFNEPGTDKYLVCHKMTCDPGWRGSLEMRDLLAQIINNYFGVDMQITPEGFCEIEVKPTEGFEIFINNLKA
jgi:hypothetical protein